MALQKTTQLSRSQALRLREEDNRVALLEREVVPLDSREEYAREIDRLWSEANFRFVLIGRYLNLAKARLPHGEYERMVTSELPFAASTARMLRIVATTIDEGRLPTERLPDSYTIVYQLASLDSDQLRIAEQENIIRPDVTRKEVLEFKQRLRELLRHTVDTWNKQSSPIADESGGHPDREALVRQRDKLLAERERIDTEIRRLDELLDNVPELRAVQA